jgi:hypothetical protein
VDSYDPRAKNGGNARPYQQRFGDRRNKKIIIFLMKSSNLFGGFIFYCYLCYRKRNNNKQKQTIMKKIVKEIMRELDTNCLTIECCDYSISGTLLTHCYYDIKTDTFAFTSGDMVEDKHAEELILNEKQKIEIFNAIIECYN